MSLDGVLLVHGGLHSSHCWGRLLPLLELPAVAIDLPGRGSRPGDLATIGLDDTVAAVLDEADRAGFGRFGLVGHSLGGLTITETAFRHPDRVGALVYVGALVPGPGQTPALLLVGEPMDGPMLPMDDALARSLFGNDLSDDDWAWHTEGIVPEAVGLMNATVSGYPTGMPITYVGMDQDQPVPPALAAQMAANLGSDVDVRSIDAGHSVMVSQPAALAAIVNEVLAAAP